MEREIALLKEQSSRDLEELLEAINEHTYALQKHNIEHPGEDLPGSQGGDEDGVELNLAFEKLRDKIQEKYDDTKSKQSTSSEQVLNLQRKISEWKALLTQDQKTITTMFQRKQELEQTSIKQVAEIVTQVKQYEQQHEIGNGLDNIDESEPLKLLSYLQKRLDEEESDATDIPISNLKKLKKRLRKLVSSSTSTRITTRYMHAFGSTHF